MGACQQISGELLEDHDIWLTDCVKGVDDLINFWQNSVNVWQNYRPSPFYDFGICYSKVIKISGELLKLGS